MGSGLADMFNPINHINPFSKKNPGNIFHSGSLASNIVDPFTRPLGLRVKKEDPRLGEIQRAASEEQERLRRENEKTLAEFNSPFQVRRRATLSSESLGSSGRRASQFLAG